MWMGLVGDRFLREPGGRWLDIATGRPARLAVHDCIGNWDDESRRLQQRLLVRCPGVGTLVDFGQLGTARWFEAFSELPGMGSPSGQVAQAVAEVLAIVDGAAAREWTHANPGVGFAWERDHLVVQLARALRARGFVALRPGARLPAALADALGHRHVALFCLDEDSAADRRHWLEHLSAASPRGHVLCLIDVLPRVGSASLAREQAIPYGVSSRREAGRAAALAHAAAALMARAEFDEAARLISVARAESAMVGTPVPVRVAMLQVQLSFWRGRFGTARAALEPLAVSADRTGWLGLLDWAIFDMEGVVGRLRDCRLAARRGDRRAAFWARLLSRLCSGDGRAGPGFAGGEMPLAEPARRVPPELVLPAEFAVMEEALGRGEVGLAGRWGARQSGPSDRGSLRGLAARWFRAQAGLSLAARAVERELAARGMLGVMRWGQRRERMRVLHFVPGLLQVVHDAEDEGAALASACSWVRTHAGARGVAVVSGRDGRVVAQDGWTDSRMAPRELTDLCREALHVDRGPSALPGVVHVAAPVRYGGAIIGHVVGRGGGGEVAAVEDAVQAMAALCGPALRARLDVRDPPDDPSALMPELLGRSPAMMAVRESIRQAARTGFPVLVEGESGTGKELVARALHRLSERRARRFMAVNCAALTDELVEAELFGFARGAFTGAVSARPGLFEEAHGGSLFLDEVGELSARAQAKLLRALQEREVRRVGENAARSVDVRVVSATNQPLAEAARLGRFREDLLFRLAVVRIGLPPLRERPEDLPALAAAFWRRALSDVGKHVRLTRDAMGALCGHGWPGNVRELQNVMAGLAVRAPARGRLGAREVRQHLGSAPLAETAGLSLDALRRQCERRAVAGALARNGGRRTAAARELGLSRQGLSKAIRRLGLDSTEDVSGVA